MIDDRQQTSRGIGLIILAMLTFATMDALSRYLVATYSIGQLLWVRYLVYPLFALWFCRGSLREGIQTRRPWLQCVRGVILLVEAMFFIGSLRYLPLAETHSIAASTPLFVTVLAAICLREQVKPDRWFAVLAGLVGTLIIIRPGFSAMSAAAVWPLSAAVFYAILQIMTRQLGRSDPSATTFIYSTIVGLVIMSFIGPFSWSSASLGDLLLMVVIGIFSAVGHFLLILAFRYAHASVLAPYTYSLVVWAVVVGFIAFVEFPDIWTFCGAGIVVVSGLYCFHRERQSAGNE